MLNLGFIGVGGYGSTHLKGFLPYHAAGKVRICALADLSPGALGLAAQYTELSSAATYRDYQELLHRDDLHAVVISAPIPAHREIALKAIRRGLFVLLEKPPVPLLSELRELIAADTNRKVMVAFQHVYKPLVRQMKAEVWSGVIGHPEAITAWGLWPRTSEYYERSPWAGKLFEDGRAIMDGPCTNAMAHFINSLFFIAGKKPTASARPEFLEGEVYRARPIASYDIGAVRGMLDNGLKFSAALSHASAEMIPARIRAKGSKGHIELFENATKLRDTRGNIYSGSDGREELRMAFIDFVKGDSKQNLTGLEATMPYVLATNMMLQSSGGIHSIPKANISTHQPDTAHTIFSVPGLKSFFDSSNEQMGSLRKAGASWAKTTQPLSFHDFDERRMLEFLRIGEPVACAT